VNISSSGDTIGSGKPAKLWNLARTVLCSSAAGSAGSRSSTAARAAASRAGRAARKAPSCGEEPGQGLPDGLGQGRG
jgi:hypothetical protein